MVPPRLTIVKSTDEETGQTAQGVADGEGASGGAPGPDRAVTTVHDLIASIETVRGKIDTLTVNEDQRASLRILEAVIFASPEPVDAARLAAQIKTSEAEVAVLLAALRADYASRGVTLVEVAGKWAFRTAEDLSWVLEKHSTEQRRLSKAALETLAIVAYHQPVTRAEIEEIRGVTISKGTLDVLMETGWVRPRGRRRAPGKPMTYGTTEAFLAHFGLASIKDLPGLAELKGSGLLDANLPPDFKVPDPNDMAALMPDELPLEDGDDEDGNPQGQLALPEREEDGYVENDNDEDRDEDENEPGSRQWDRED